MTTAELQNNESNEVADGSSSTGVSKEQAYLSTIPLNAFGKPDFTKLNSAKVFLKADLDMKEVLVYGDVHGTDRKSKIHVDYEEDTVYVLMEILRQVKERKPVAVVLAGDLIGIDKDKNVKTLQFQAFVHMTLKRIADEVNDNLFITLGNHDEGATLTDTQYFLMTGVLRNVDYLDIDSCRIHLVNYGEETRHIDIKEDAYNVAVTHAEFHVGRQTNWFFNSSKSFELDKMMNFKGIDYVLTGHVHKPSPYPITTSIEDKNITLLYLGSPTRPRVTDTYDYVHVASIQITKNEVRMEHIKWDLPPNRFVMQAEEQELENLTNVLNMLNTSNGETTNRQQDLADALSGLTEYGLIGTGQDFISNLNRIGAMDTEALALATAKLEAYASSSKAKR